MLDRHPELAIPDESFFVPLLAHRHRSAIDVAAFIDDLRRLPRVRDWGVPIRDVEARLRPGMALGDAIGAVYEAYAARHGKTRWGDKTPLYMQHLGTLERLFPDALYLHLIRDGRDAAASFLAMPEGVVTRTWAHPRSAADFACQWRMEVLAARRLGSRVGPGRYVELRYEALVADPERELSRAAAFAGLAFHPAMLEYAGTVDLSRKPHLQRLSRPPTAGLRDWRRDMPAEDVAAFEAIAGDLLAGLGYEVADPSSARGPTAKGRARLVAYAARARAWRTAGHAAHRSPLWKRRHPVLV